MKPEELLKTMGEIAPEYVESAEALQVKRAKRRRLWPAAAAAAALAALGLAFAVKGIIKDRGPSHEAVNTGDPTEAVSTETPTEAATEAPTEAVTAVPTYDPNEQAARQARIADAATALAYVPEVPHVYNSEGYRDYLRTLRQTAYSAGDGLGGFFNDTAREFLLSAKAGENAAYSPLNVYFSLAMLAESTSGETRAQILNLLGAADIEALRAQADLIWLANYYDNDLQVSLPAASLWLNSAFAGSLNASTVQRIAEKYHASVFEGDMADPAYTLLYRDWLNEQTRDLLKDSVEKKELAPSELMHAAATLYYKMGWAEEFNEENNYEGLFRSPSGDEAVTYMQGSCAAYYDGDGYKLTYKALNNGSRCWFVLPDEGFELNGMIGESDALAVIESVLGGQELMSMEYSVHLHLPKFDVSSEFELSAGLKKLGVTDCFDAARADFSELTELEGVHIDKVDHGVRVIADETGVEAAAITEWAPTNGEPPSKTVELVLDRPFLFMITGADGTPLFIGTVNHPAK